MEKQVPYFFLGPKSEQRSFMEEVLQLLLNDHVFWRRNFYPKDPPSLSYSELHSKDCKEWQGRFFQELFELIADLKLDIPFFSPRYMAHMVSEVALPGLFAYFATMLYNPNNVSKEASPVTLQYELEVGKQFGQLFGFSKERCFGHLTSGGTIANYESLWIHKNVKCFPLAVALFFAEKKQALPSLFPATLWECLNLSPSVFPTWLQEITQELSSRGFGIQEVIQSTSCGALGDWEFFKRCETLFQTPWVEPVVLLPETAHYSWKRSANLFGIGKKNYLPIAVDSSFRLKTSSLRETLQLCLEQKIPIYQTVLVAGTTEFGSVDPVAEVVDLRQEFTKQGLSFSIHLDAAYGGYFATMFEPSHEKTTLLFEDTLRSQFKAFGECDSVTVDPHKLGYAPYGAGAFVLKEGMLKELVAQSASYCFDEIVEEEKIHLGKYILEGSKPGAVAAAVWFNHKMIPLDRSGYGGFLEKLCRNAQQAYLKIQEFNQTLCEKGSLFRLELVNQPELNVLCFFAISTLFTQWSEINQLNHRLVQRFGVKEVESIQQYDYIVSHTWIDASLAFVQEHNKLQAMKNDQDSIEVLRLVFMNQWVEGKERHKKDYFSDFLQKVESCLEDVSL